MIRYMALQYRDELMAIQQEEVAAQTRLSANDEQWASPSHRRTPSTRWRSSARADAEKDQVASDLLTILQSIPIQVIGTPELFLLPNSYPLPQTVARC